MAPAGDWLRPQGVETCRDPRAVSGPAVRVLWRPMESMNGGRRSSPLASLAGACTMATLLLKVQLTVICEWSYWLSAPCPCSLSPPWSGARSAAWVQALAPLPAAHVCSPSSPFLPLLLLTALLLPGLEVDSVFSFFNLQFLVGKFHLKLLHSFFFPTFVTFPFCPRPAPVTGSHHSIPFCCPPDGDRDLNRIEIFPASLTCCRLAFPTYLNVYGRCQRGSSGLVLPLG